ncbi:nicotinic acid phosphoribosyltransferase [Arthrobacter sp. UYCu712]
MNRLENYRFTGDVWGYPRGGGVLPALPRPHGGVELRRGAVRLDSGGLVAQATWVRQRLDRLGKVRTKIVVTSDLDEYSLAALRSAPADAYGIGTAVVTGSGAPPPAWSTSW